MFYTYFLKFERFFYAHENASYLFLSISLFYDKLEIKYVCVCTENEQLEMNFHKVAILESH